MVFQKPSGIGRFSAGIEWFSIHNFYYSVKTYVIWFITGGKEELQVAQDLPACSQICSRVVQSFTGPCFIVLLCIVISDMACSSLDAAREEARCDPTNQTNNDILYFFMIFPWLVKAAGLILHSLHWFYIIRAPLNFGMTNWRSMFYKRLIYWKKPTKLSKSCSSNKQIKRQ